MPRPKTLIDKTRIRIAPEGRSRLQANSARRAIVNFMVDQGGVVTVKEVNDHFGFDITDQIRHLLRIGWVQIVEPKDKK